mmetsp:Transcript_61850/g.184236  ORF Transcript_61850/g.184236 Transcript_61850/m.184236 type:complete len:223 (-) Transcript_61850:765-1433(-)
MPAAFRADSTRARQPQAFGAAMEVPFMSLAPASVQFGIDVMAEPGAQTVTPRLPSCVGPRLVHVYGVAGTFSSIEYWASMAGGLTCAPIVMKMSEPLPGAPMVERAGPLLPAEVTKMMPCWATVLFANSMIRPVAAGLEPSPKERLMRSTLALTQCAKARARPVPVSMPSSLVSPIFRETTCAPGATPFRWGSSWWQAAAMPATCVPWEEMSQTIETTAPSS